MEQFEKVCKGLEVHIKPNSRCVGCPYPNNGLCGDQLYSDALSMIRQQQERIKELEAAQTARVMTLDEVKHVEVCWVEESDETYVYPAIYYGQMKPYEKTVFVVDYDDLCERDFEECFNEHRQLSNDEYGILWRCWTQRPTDEQRKAVKWDD